MPSQDKETAYARAIGFLESIERVIIYADYEVFIKSHIQSIKKELKILKKEQ